MSSRHTLSHRWKWPVAALTMLCIVGLLLPSMSRVQRETTIDAPQATVYALLNDFSRREVWSPRTAADANARVELFGEQRGVAAGIRWNGQIAGRGVETITDSKKFDYIASLLIENDRSPIQSTFELTKVKDQTRVVWTQSRDHRLNIVARYFGLFGNFVRGPKLETDLEKLENLASALPSADFSTLEIEQLDVEASDIAFLRTTSMPIAAAISEAMGDAYFEILSFIDDQSLLENGAPMSITRSFSGAELVFDAAIPVTGLTALTDRTGQAVQVTTTYAGPVIRVRHVGSYRALGQTHEKIAAYLAAMGILRNGDAWESYTSDPSRTSEADLVTFVYYPIED